MTKILAVLFIVVAAFWAAVAGYWSTQREAPVAQLLNVVETPVVHAGEQVVTRHIVERRALCHTVVERTVIDSQRTRWALADLDFYAIGALGRDEYKQATQVPNGAAPGPAVLRFALAWRCNPIHAAWPITYQVPDMHFTIVRD